MSDRWGGSCIWLHEINALYDVVNYTYASLLQVILSELQIYVASAMC